MDEIREGVRRFRTVVFRERRELYESLAEKQKPFALFLTCGDSRIEPSLLTGTSPGQIFVERTPGNIVPMYEDTVSVGVSASIEYAVAVLGVAHVIVCGHSTCGAMKGLLHPETLAGIPATARWLEYAQPALQVLERHYRGVDESDRLKTLAQLNVLEQMAHLHTHPTVEERFKRGSLGIHGWFYEIHTGTWKRLIRKPGNSRGGRRDHMKCSSLTIANKRPSVIKAMANWRPQSGAFSRMDSRSQVIRTLLTIAVVLLPGILGFGKSSKLVMSWRNPDATVRKFHRVLALGLSDKKQIRADFEDALATELTDTGVEAIPGNTILLRPEGTQFDLNYLRTQVRDHQIDAVVVSRLINDEKKTTYIPGTAYFTPYPYYNTFYGYYGTVYPVVYSPGYLREERKVRIETNLYVTSSPDGQLVWMGITDTFDPTNVHKAINRLVKLVVKQMQTDGVLWTRRGNQEPLTKRE